MVRVSACLLAVCLAGIASGQTCGRYYVNFSVTEGTWPGCLGCDWTESATWVTSHDATEDLTAYIALPDDVEFIQIEGAGSSMMLGIRLYPNSLGAMWQLWAVTDEYGYESYGGERWWKIFVGDWNEFCMTTDEGELKRHMKWGGASDTQTWESGSCGMDPYCFGFEGHFFVDPDYIVPDLILCFGAASIGDVEVFLFQTPSAVYVFDDPDEFAEFSREYEDVEQSDPNPFGDEFFGMIEDTMGWEIGVPAGSADLFLDIPLPTGSAYRFDVTPGVLMETADIAWSGFGVQGVGSAGVAAREMVRLVLLLIAYVSMFRAVVMSLVDWGMSDVVRDEDLYDDEDE